MYNKRLTVDEFIGLKEFGFISLLFLSKLLGIGTTFTILFSLIGFFYPDIWLNDLVKKRKNKILKEFPDSIDQLALLVEAGIDFISGLQKIVNLSSESPLIEEYRLIIDKIRAGMLRNEALREFQERVNIEDVSTFVFALLQADKLGVSISETLKVQSGEIRFKRMQRAEKLASEAPVKMLLPMVIFIFPVIFLIIFGSLIINIIGAGLRF